MKLNKGKNRIAALAMGFSLALVATGCAPAGSGEAAPGSSSAGAASSDTIKIGVLSTSEGNLAFGMDEAKAAIGVAMEARGGTVEGGTIAGKKVELIYEGTDGTSASAQTKAKKLVENEGVDIVFGPASGDEGETVVQYALTEPDVTFVNGAASPVGMTLQNAENFFRFMGDSAMWMGGLGDHAFKEKGYKKVYSIAEDYSFPYDNAGGFFSEFCAAGGEVTGNSWVPVGTTDYATIISKIPADTDAVYVGLGGADAASFLSQAVTAGVEKPLIGGSITVDTTALSGDANISDAAVGTITGGPVPGADYDNPVWKTFSEAYAKQPKAFPSPSIFGILYYNAFESLLLGIEETKGELGEKHADLRASLSNLKWDTPTGPISMDKNRQAIVDNFLIEVVDDSSGELTQKNLSKSSNVTQGTTVYDRFDGCPN
ncbi:ABC transporter substrate-binding protein [Arthrobacter sp. MYb227]|uniref:ABC transporter substrate-binding protein n=1 Tax=Arthrobacter sp. MYb227 TaxID=1848601 RepID=UPI000CFB3EEA|nr:ABC transporter substrate-binding protein [Arthrobacter sp. MYb227]PQZ93581.1 ABC transporter substrate-binding protein [Arthrobacter sp. MYb227]